MKTERFELKLSPEDKAVIIKAANIHGLSIGSYMLSVVVPMARKAAKK